MASRRATAVFAKAATPAPRALRAAAQLSMRQHHTLQPTQQQPLCVRRAPSSCLLSKPVSRLGTASARAYSTDGGSPAKIWDFEEVQRLATTPSRSITLIDVREPNELEATGRIPGAINIPVKSAPDSYHITDEEFEDRFGFPRPARDAEVVMYCRSGVRSHAAASLAHDAGWTKVGEYPGSWLDWAEKGGKVQS